MATERTSLLIEPVTPLDGELFAGYGTVRMLGTETYDRLLPDKDIREAEKQRFFESGCENTPDLRPRNLDGDALAGEETRLQEFKEEVAAFPVASIAQAYRWRVNEQIANVRLLQAVADEDPRRFDRYNHFVYGSPDRDIFGAAVDWMCARAEQQLQSGVPAVREAAEPMLELMDGMRGDRNLIVPSAEVFQTVRESQFKKDGFFALILAGVELDPKAKITRENGDPALRRIIDNIGSTYEARESSGSGWSVSARDEAVKHPASYNYPYRRWQGLVAGHEVGSHLLETMNGGRGPLRLSSSGLDRADNGNEGRAVVREQVVYDSFDAFARIQRWQVILRRHIATALRLGQGGHPMDFPETYRHMYAIDRLYERQQTPEDPDAADEKARRRAYSVMEEVNKGTDGSSGPYRRYPLYLEGNARWWNLLAVHPERLDHGDLCKADLTASRHVDLLERLHVIPKLSSTAMSQV